MAQPPLPISPRDVEASVSPVFIAPTVPKKLKHKVLFSRPDPDCTMPFGATPHFSMHSPLTVGDSPPPTERTPLTTATGEESLISESHGSTASGKMNRRRDNRESKKAGLRQNGLAAHAIFAKEVAEDQAEQNQSHYEVPTSSTLTLLQMGMCTGYVCYTLSAWVYCTIERDAILPRCVDVWPHHPKFSPLVGGCIVSTLAFWTLPIFCSFFVLVLFYRDLLHTRIWYEMLGHKTLINFTIQPFTQHATARAVLGWLLVSVSMLFFTRTFSLSTLQKTLPYWLPILSWLGLTYTQWDINERLLSVPKFVQGNPEWAKHYLMTCTFMHDHIAKIAFERVLEELTPSQTPMQSPRCSSATPSESGASGLDDDGVSSARPTPHRRHNDALGAYDPGSTLPHHLYHHTTGGMIHKMIETITLMQQNGDVIDEPNDAEMHGFLEVWSMSYWVRGFLFSAKLKDLRARRFGRWFRAYTCFSYVLMALMVYLMWTSIVSCLLHQEVLEDTWYTRAMSAGFMEQVKSNLKAPDMEGFEHLKEGLEYPVQARPSL